MTRQQRRRPTRKLTWLLPACAAMLAIAVIARGFDGGDTSDPKQPPASARATTSAITYEPGTVPVPAGWRVLDRRGNVTTWSEPDNEDAVTVAAVESSDVPLAAVVADVATASRQLESATHVAAPHELQLERGARGDSALLLRMTLRDPRGRDLHVRQIWRRDARAAQDVVATWTSRDEEWPTAPEDGIPEVGVR